ncbi:MAG: hypothetical protein ACP6IU_15325 [Candidatus Asgardarchaeia archaeon]
MSYAFFKVTKTGKIRQAFLVGDFTKINEIIKNNANIIYDKLIRRFLKTTSETRGGNQELLLAGPQATSSLNDIVRVSVTFHIEDLACNLLNEMFEKMGIKFRLKVIEKDNEKSLVMTTTENLPKDELINEIFSFGLSMKTINNILEMEKERKTDFACNISAKITLQKEITQELPLPDDLKRKLSRDFKLKLEIFNKGTLPVKLLYVQQAIPPTKIEVLEEPQNAMIAQYDIHFLKQNIIEPKETVTLFFKLRASETIDTEYTPALIYLCNDKTDILYMPSVKITIYVLDNSTSAI